MAANPLNSPFDPLARFLRGESLGALDPLAQLVNFFRNANDPQTAGPQRQDDPTIQAPPPEQPFLDFVGSALSGDPIIGARNAIRDVLSTPTRFQEPQPAPTAAPPALDLGPPELQETPVSSPAGPVSAVTVGGTPQTNTFDRVPNVGFQGGDLASLQAAFGEEPEGLSTRDRALNVLAGLASGAAQGQTLGEVFAGAGAGALQGAVTNRREDRELKQGKSERARDLFDAQLQNAGGDLAAARINQATAIQRAAAAERLEGKGAPQVTVGAGGELIFQRLDPDSGELTVDTLIPPLAELKAHAALRGKGFQVGNFTIDTADMHPAIGQVANLAGDIITGNVPSGFRNSAMNKAVEIVSERAKLARESGAFESAEDLFTEDAVLSEAYSIIVRSLLEGSTRNKFLEEQRSTTDLLTGTRR